ncbi:MAG TPA: glycoside hydrolase family 30 protein [Rhodothermales bacterium]|nr:glycoside hydrolase family 30 protein [Rhodothermales bacterium]
MRHFILTFIFFLGIDMAISQPKNWQINAWKSSADGHALTKVNTQNVSNNPNVIIRIQPKIKFQKILGFGGAFTEATTHLLQKLSEANRKKILNAYFGQEGANYSLCRTQINSSDFSIGHYAYAITPGDTLLKHFDIGHDEETIIPIIKEAQKISKEGFNLIASPWTAPPWMKDNNHWVGGKLKPEYYATWALYFSKYLDAYKKHQIPFWGITVENEPNGNGNNWESMHYTPQEMTNFVQHYLGPHLEKNGYGNIKILGYDQNRADLKNWVDEMYRTPESSHYYHGTAIHWYESTYDYFPEALDYAHHKVPGKYLIQTEACIDAEVPVWQDDQWYWQPHATDWGYDWAPEHEKYLHPKYAPVYRYAEDIIGSLNHWVEGWIDWNMVLDQQGGPNWFENWCIAPIIVNVEKDEVYFTPLYYVMSHFSKFIRPGAHRIGLSNLNSTVHATAVENPDHSIVLVLLNKEKKAQTVAIHLDGFSHIFNLDQESLQTITLKPQN